MRRAPCAHHLPSVVVSQKRNRTRCVRPVLDECFSCVVVGAGDCVIFSLQTQRKKTLLNAMLGETVCHEKIVDMYVKRRVRRVGTRSPCVRQVPSDQSCGSHLEVASIPRFTSGKFWLRGFFESTRIENETTRTMMGSVDHPRATKPIS